MPLKKSDFIPAGQVIAELPAAVILAGRNRGLHRVLFAAIVAAGEAREDEDQP